MFYIIILILLLIPAACMMPLFQKMGKNPLVAIIPFYGAYTKFKLTGKQKLFIVHAISQISTAILLFCTYSVSFVFFSDAYKQKQARNLMMIFTAIALVCYLINAITNYAANRVIVKTFGGTDDDAVKMAFLPVVFTPIFVAKAVLGKATPTTKTQSTTKPSSRFNRMY